MARMMETDMGKTVDGMVAALSPDRQRRVHARTEELVGEEMTLRDLRKAMGRTQAQVARLTGKPQATISRMEAQSDMLLSNLDQVVGALGGRIRIVAELPGRAPVLLTGLGDLSGDMPEKPPRRGKTAHEPIG